MVTIGVVGSKGTKRICNILKEDISKFKKKTIIVNSSMQYKEKEFIFFDVDYLIIDMIDFYNDYYESILNDIKILIVTEFDTQNAEYLEKMQKVISRINEGGYIIFSSDNLDETNLKWGDIYPITYGFNGKTTVTASSIDDMNGLEFSYCLQRSLATISNEVVRPFEKPMCVSGDYDDITYYMAAFTCIIILGLKF